MSALYYSYHPFLFYPPHNAQVYPFNNTDFLVKPYLLKSGINRICAAIICS
jgi:hypothetical protein